MPLDATLKWLKAELSKYGTTNGGTYFFRLKLTKFTGCELAFRYGPLVPPDVSDNESSSFPSEEEYSLNLADLDPASLTVRASETSATKILVGTWDLERKIKVVDQDPVTGKGYGLSPELMSFLTLRFAKTKSAPQIRDALVHAILLCQKQP